MRACSTGVFGSCLRPCAPMSRSPPAAAETNIRVRTLESEHKSRGWSGGGRRLERPESEDPVRRIDAGQYTFADQVAQGFGRAAPESAVARPAIEARHREFVGEAVAAVDLDRLACHPQGHLVDRDLGGGGEQRVGKRVGAGAGAIEDAAARLDVAIHLGELPAHALKLADRTSKRLALLGVFDRLLECAFGEPERDAGVEATLRVEGG